MASKKISSKNVVVSAPALATPRKRTIHSRPVKPAETPSLAETAAPVAAAPLQDEIASLAYLYWEARGYQGGSPEEDWLRAERELRARAIA
jgi:hypothetical protein